MSENNSLVDVLVDARLEARQVKTLDRTWKLRTEDEGYQTMFLVSERLGWQQAGWKIAATNLQVQQQLRTDSPVFGPIFQNHIVQSPAMIAYERLLSPIVECEFFFRMNRSLPARSRPYGFDDVQEAIGSVYVGIEVAECRYSEARLPPKEFIIADGFASGWYVVGPKVEHWREVFDNNVSVALYKNGGIRAEGSSSDVMGHPVAPIVWLANKLNGMGRQISEGQMISSGTCNILARARQGDSFKAVYNGIAEIDLHIS